MGDNSDHGQGLGDQALFNVPPNLSGMPIIRCALANRIANPNYWRTLVSELMKPIIPAPFEVNDGKYNPMELKEWIRGMDKIFTVADVPYEKKVNIRMFYITGEVDIWWNTVKDKLLGPEFTWSEFLEELRAKFYPVVVQQ